MVVAASTTSPAWTPFIASAPGKAIIFGEHAAVYGKPAIAGSVSMRAYALVTPRTDSHVRLLLPDIDVDLQVPSTDLPSKHEASMLAHPGDVVDILPASLRKYEGAGRTAVTTFAFLCGALLSAEQRASGFSICVRSLLPVGSGLGSSAAFNVALASALLRLGGVVDHADGPEERLLVNRWAFKGEQVAHGTPSGIDNSVVTFGGFLKYTKNAEPVQLESAPNLQVLIWDTQVPKSTKALVAGVRVLRDAHPEAIDSVMNAIGAISSGAADLFCKADTPVDKLEHYLADVVRLNHALLVALGVSHPALERVREATEARALPTKLTGAGGGGCALTLVPKDASTDDLDSVISELSAEGIRCYPTVIGGCGVAVSDVVAGEPVLSWLERAGVDAGLCKLADNCYEPALARFASLPNPEFAALAP
ncbi:Mevalonate kinase [Coemansia sp. RSA 1722]|nr:Mevalonate kinase [Coemansia sp. RSA 486]KAJ2232067.1 Mevalonate kinase [Coemansia sp. RSA 485]KAJ2589807.1 Mevalonate kinase [Coemansia sp. RSA 1722]KAJ2600810.1 Mevalonate kinase [Coemansia sp. RSA 1721]